MIFRLPKIAKKVLQANPSALHEEGVKLKNILNGSRETVAKILEVMPAEIFFTSGATESDNLAINGTVQAWLKKGIQPEEILVYFSDLEHSAVKETVKNLGVKTIELESVEGMINPKDILIPRESKAVLISIMYVNNEIGTVEDIIEISKRVRYLRKHNPDVKIFFHTDATQAPLHFSLRVPTLGVDMMTLGSTKLYCRKGVGVLFKKRNVNIQPLNFGGGQEFGLRPGTEPVELIYEFSEALKYATKIREKESERIRAIRDYFESEIKKNFKHLRISTENSLRTPHISHVAFKDFDSELFILELDSRGISVSAKSACLNEEEGESKIVEKLHGTNWGAVRFSFGRKTNKGHIDTTIRAIKSVVQKYRLFD